MTNTENKITITGRNPFEAQQIKDCVTTLSKAESAVNRVRAFIRNECPTYAQLLPAMGDISLYELFAQGMLGQYRSQPSITRFFGQRSVSDASEIWVVLDRKTSAKIFEAYPDDESDERHDAVSEVVGALWQSWGMEPSATPPSGCSPTGRWFRNKLCFYRVGAHIVLRQTGGLDC